MRRFATARDARAELDLLTALRGAGVPVCEMVAAAQPCDLVPLHAPILSLASIPTPLISNHAADLAAAVVGAIASLDRHGLVHATLSPSAFVIVDQSPQLHVRLVDAVGVCCAGDAIATPSGAPGFRHPVLEARGTCAASARLHTFSVVCIAVWLFSGRTLWSTAVGSSGRLAFRPAYLMYCGDDELFSVECGVPLSWAPRLRQALDAAMGWRTKK